MAEKPVAPGEVGGGKTIGRGESHFDDGVGGQVRAQARAGLSVEGQQRTDDDGRDGELVLLLDDEAQAGARRGVDPFPAEQVLDRRGVAPAERLAQLGGQHAHRVRLPPGPDGDQEEPERQAEDRREDATEPRRTEEKRAHAGEGR